jgi:hypothetical protein
MSYKTNVIYDFGSWRKEFDAVIHAAINGNVLDRWMDTDMLPNIIK